LYAPASRAVRSSGACGVGVIHPIGNSRAASYPVERSAPAMHREAHPQPYRPAPRFDWSADGDGAEEFHGEADATAYDTEEAHDESKNWAIQETEDSVHGATAAGLNGSIVYDEDFVDDVEAVAADY